MKKLFQRKRLKKKLFKATRGAISLMLCILITPFLSMAGALIELSRYQSATELMQEVIDSSMLSVLADYDEYLEDRFGLFAVSQDNDMSESFNSYLKSNSNILGGAVSVDSASLNGKFSLSAKGDSGDYDVLEAQLLDFSETSALTETLLENFKLQDIIDALKDITGFSNITSIASNVKDATSAIKSLVESAENLYNDLNVVYSAFESASQSVQRIVDTFNNIASDVQTTLEFNISEYQIAEDENGGLILQRIEPTGEENDTIDIISELKDSKYVDYFNLIKIEVASILTDIGDVTSTVDKLPADLTAFQNSLSNAKTVVEKIKNIGSSSTSSAETSDSKKDAMKESAQSSATELSEVFDEIISDLEESVSDISIDMLSEIKSSVTDILGEFKNEVSNIVLLKNYNPNFISSDLLNTVAKYFVTALKDGGAVSLDSFYSYFLSNNSIAELFNSIKEIPSKLLVAVEKAWTSLKDAVSDSVISALKSLVNTIAEMFKIDIVDTDLNAYLNDEVASGLAADNGPYAKFLEGVSDLIDEVNGLSGGDDSDESIWDKIKGFIDSLFGIFEAVEKVLSSILDLVKTFIEKISDFIEAVKQPENFYDFFLLAGYMIHNLPNRLTELDSESAITGFPYSDLPTDNISSSSGFNNTGLGDLAGYLKEDSDGSGGNRVFKGAEVEYIMAGTRSEIMNQLVAFMQIYMIRLLLNLPIVFTDGSVSSMAATANIFGWIVYLVILLAEPLCDTILIVKGGEINLLKNKCFLTPTGIPKLIEAYKDLGVNTLVTNTLESLKGNLENVDQSSSENNSGGAFKEALNIGYEDHLLICIALMLPKDQLLTRFANLIQIEAKQYYSTHGGKPFDINKAYTCVTCDATVTYYPFISIFEAAGLSTFSVDYEQDRSY